MSKIPKWKVEKAKVKVVFRLQFHATHLPQTGWDKLFLSFIPAETGKPSAKTNKANVRNGNCKWSDPIYEATRLIQDTRTKKYDDKFYKLIVAMGSSRASILGEADLNLAEFVDALKPSTVALPLHGSDCGTVLHVTVQILTTKTGFREFEQQSVKGSQIASGQNTNISSDIVGPSSDEKMNARVRLKETNSESTEDGLDGSSHTSDSLHAEKTEIPLFPLNHNLNKHEKDDFTPNTRLSPQGSTDWTPGWGSDYENSDLALAYEENSRLRVRLEVAESAFLQLKSEAKSLQRITDELGAETQGLACQLAAELDSGQILAREVSVLKTECSNLKRDVSELESVKPRNQFLSDKGLAAQALVLIESKVHEIRDKACIGFRADSFGFDFLDSDFEAVLRDLDGLRQGLKNHNRSDNQEEDPLVKKEKMCELLQKLEDSKTENEILVKKMNQMERYYESFIHQLEESQKQTIKELETLKDEHSSSLYATSLLQSQIEKLHEEMSGQMVRSVEERKDLEKLNEEMERRAVASETALKRVRRNYTAAVDRLQKDLELLSFQVLSMYESNETLAKQPSADSDPISNLNLNSNPKNQFCLNGDSFEYGSSLAAEEERSKEKPRCIEIHADTDHELVNMYVGTVQLRIFSDLLVGALNHANDGLNRMKKRKIDLETELLELKEISKEFKAKYVSECDDLAVKIQILEMKLQNVTEERDRFESLLAVETAQKGYFEAKIGALGEESRVLKEEMNKINEEKERVEKMKVNFENKLREAELDLEGSRMKLEFSSGVIESLQQELRDVTEKFKSSSEAAELHKRENNDLMAKLKLLEIELEQVSEESKTLVRNLQEENQTVRNELGILNEGNANLGNLLKKTELDLEEVMQKFETAREAEEMQKRENRELMENMEMMEMEVRRVTGESRDLMCKLKESGGTGEELEKTKTSLVICKEENGALKCELQNLREFKVSLESELEASRRKLDVSRETIEKLERELLEVRESFSISSEAEQLHSKSNSELLSKFDLMETNLTNCEDELQRTKIKLISCEEAKRDLENEFEMLREKKCIFENLLKQAESDLEACLTKIDISNKTIEKLELELREVREIHANENLDLVSKLESLEIELKDSEIVLERTRLSLVCSEEEKRNLEKELQIFENIMVDFQNSTSKLDHSEKNAQNLQRELQEVTERFDKENLELKSKLEFVQFELEQLRNECTDLNRKFHESESSREELEKNKEILEDEIVELNLNQSDLNAQLEEREKEMVLFYKEKTKLRERIVELEKANISMQNLILRNEENQRKLEFEFENRLMLILEELVASDVEANYMQSQLQELNSQFNYFKNEFQNENEISQLEKEVEFLRFSKEEAEILNLILRSKLEERDAIISTLKESKIELGDLRENQRELTRRLSEQILKTEEYKNLSIHFKEKSEEQSTNQAIEKRETESLRIAFIKEQYESKIQEMKNQLGVSKKYAEEMLVKLQNAQHEVNSGKKNEIALVKRIEELSISLSELETEIQEIRTDRRELVSAYDNLKTELECASLSFDCCKEEKAKLEACFQECSEERRKIKVELDLVKRLMENMALAGNGDVQSNESNGSIEELLEAGVNGSRSIGGEERRIVKQNSIVGSPVRAQSSEKCEGEQALKDEHFEKHQKLKIALSLFQKELEKLKNENISYLIPQEGDQIDPSLHGLERALSQLDTANEHLGIIFPSFKLLSGSGNALERVLALELELAEALQEKKRADTRFQSSFLKQHNNEAAIFQSFRDINELIQDMLQLRKKNVTVESELKEMHGRYSQLSLQFAEVEGERQKLMMSLKNRSPRKS